MTDAVADPFEIVEVDIRGVRTRVFRNAPAHLGTIWASSETFAERTYLVFGDERVSYGQAHRQVRALAHRMREVHGIRHGDRVAIAARNYPEWAVAFWATVACGAVAVPLNAWWTGPELAYGLADSGAVLLFADDERAERIAPHLAETAVRTTVLIRSERDLPGAESFADAVGGDAPPLPDVSIQPDDDASIMYTSGTTGKPKGAVQTHRNFVAFLMNLAYRTALAAAAAPPPPPGPPLPADRPRC
jgi:long-chain acyl-CoA synthetase